MKKQNPFFSCRYVPLYKLVLFIFSFIYTLNYSWAMSGIGKIQTTADSALVSFIESMKTPALTPSSAEQLKHFMSSENGLLKENQELKSKVLGASTKILERVITCLPDHTVVHRQLKSKLEEIVKELSDIKVFALQDNSKYGILTQFRMGAINLPNKFILFNLKYPTLDDSRNKPFYFHEVFRISWV